MSKRISFTILLTACLMFLGFYANAQDDNIMIHVDEMPYFPGCNDFEGNPDGHRKCSNYNLVSFISTTLKYPEEAKKKGIEGTVIVSFVVNTDGSIQNAFVLKDVGGGCGVAALDVVEQMPTWLPGRNDGEKVRVKLNLPIKFGLSGEGVSSKYRILWGNIKGRTITKKEIKANLLETIYVRGPYGENVTTSEIIIAYERKNRFLDANSQGKINENQKRLLKKARKKGIITISATIQKNGQFIEVDREFEVVKKKSTASPTSLQN